MGSLFKISGPVVIAEGMRGSKINDLVKIGEDKLLGEIIGLRGENAIIQVYEETSGLKPGDEVENTGEPLSVLLGPGLLASVYDGIQRPLNKIQEEKGIYITRGVNVPSIDLSKKFDFTPLVKKGHEVKPGDKIGYFQELNIKHYVLAKVKGKVTSIEEGKIALKTPVAVIGKDNVFGYEKWPVRKSRPYKLKMNLETPLITGKRIIDSFFPLSKGGTAAIPGPFGSGKSVNQQDLAKYSDADIIVYIGCGERGNEMTEVLTEFPHLKDPRTGKPLMDRTVLVANTSNMPVAAREASIYTGITIAEYYRDMGYDVALMADSTSRWAEAMREISGRLEEMPGEEGYPAYLSRKLAEFYERSGRVECLDGKTIGSVSVVGAVSPPGGDISEPVSQATLRITKAFWALDSSLSRRRHYPAINWLKSYSLYAEVLTPWFQEHVSKDFMILREKALKMLQREAELQNIIQLVGPDSLPDKERLLLEFTRSLREDFLQQNSFDEVDCYTNLKKQYLMLKNILVAYEKFDVKLSTGVTLEELMKNDFFKKCSRFKFENEKTLEEELKKIEKF